MQNIIVYFPYKLQKNPKSGSGVRPKKIVESFQKYAHTHNIEIVVISGESSDRKIQIQAFIQSGKVKDTLFCYMENSTMPYWLTDGDHVPRHPFMDMSFWKYLKQNNIQISCFYRDVYWKFDDLYNPPGGKKMLTPVMRKIYQKELDSLHKAVDLLYLPSLEMNDYVGWQGEYSELPPGMDGLQMGVKDTQSQPLSTIFVGGISDQKGIMIMLQALKSINEQKRVHLHLVCREEEYRRYPAMHEFEQYPWLTVHHKSGKELEDLYSQTHLALIPRELSIYHHFAVPVKMFEYLSNGLPIVATKCKAQARIMEAEGIGITTEENVEAFAEGILTALDLEQYEKMRTNIEQHILKNHSWQSRVEKVANDMIGRSDN